MPIVLHIPHASTTVPDDVREQFLIDREELDREINLLTDHATDLIFKAAFPKATACEFPVSRFVVDPERFEDDAEESMAETGMGMIYTHGTQCQPIRRELTHAERESLLEKYYRPHHDELTWAVQRHLEKNGKYLVLDCHSFPAKALPCEHDQDARRPQFCVGTDRFHTPETLVANVERELTCSGFNVARDEPYKGSLVPLEYSQRDRRVQSLMIEVNRSLYMNDDFSLSEQGLEQLIATLRELQPTLLSSL